MLWLNQTVTESMNTCSWYVAAKYVDSKLRAGNKVGYMSGLVMKHIYLAYSYKWVNLKPSGRAKSLCSSICGTLLQMVLPASNLWETPVLPLCNNFHLCRV